MLRNIWFNCTVKLSLVKTDEEVKQKGGFLVFAGSFTEAEKMINEKIPEYMERLRKEHYLDEDCHKSFDVENIRKTNFNSIQIAENGDNEEVDLFYYKVKVDCPYEDEKGNEKHNRHWDIVFADDITSAMDWVNDLYDGEGKAEGGGFAGLIEVFLPPKEEGEEL